MKIEDMKKAIVKNEMEYVKEISYYENELFDYVYAHSYRSFKNIDDKDVIELYTNIYGDIDE